MKDTEGLLLIIISQNPQHSRALQHNIFHFLGNLHSFQFNHTGVPPKMINRDVTVIFLLVCLAVRSLAASREKLEERQYLIGSEREDGLNKRMLDEVGSSLLKKRMSPEENDYLMKTHGQKRMLDEVGSSLLKKRMLDEVGSSLLKKRMLDEVGSSLLKKRMLDEVGSSLLKKRMLDEVGSSLLKKRMIDPIGSSLIKKRMLDEVGSSLLRKRYLDRLGSSLIKKDAEEMMAEGDRRVAYEAAAAANDQNRGYSREEVEELLGKEFGEANVHYPRQLDETAEGLIG